MKGIIVSSVRNNPEEIINELREKSGCELIVDFNQEEIKKYSDSINYKGLIGRDRVAAYLGAETLLPKSSKLIIDAGTAITLDIADIDGKYCGGNISLGLYSRMKALSNSTCLLPNIENITMTSDFGNDTASAIMDGAFNGVVGEILYTIKLAKRNYNIEWVVLTGGDSECFFSTVKNAWKNCVFDPDLVGRGLNYHLRKFYFPETHKESLFIPKFCV